MLEVQCLLSYAFDLWCANYSPLLPSSHPVWPSRDRMMLLKLEQDILEFINDDK